MAEFLECQAIDIDAADGSVDHDSEKGEDVATVSDNEFIDDGEIEQDESGYSYFTNVTRSYDDVMQDVDLDNLEARHFYDSDDDEDRLHEFDKFEAKVKAFHESLINPFGLENPDSFFYSILYAIRHKFTKKIDFLNEEDILKQDVGVDLSTDLFQIKSSLRLDSENKLNFENQCFTVNNILSGHNLFLRVFELKDKFHYLIKQNSEQKKIVNEVSACLIERFNGFTIVRLEFDNQVRREFSPINIIYKPVKKRNAVLNCFFTDRLHLAYKAVYNESVKWDKLKSACAFECYFCGRFWVRQSRLELHMKNFVGKPGFVYNFQTRNLLTYEENIKLKRDVPLTAYIDFETTAATDCCLDPESNKMNVVSFVIILAFHPKLQLPRIIIERSFGHSLERLCQIDYLTAEQLKYGDVITIKQLRDCAIAVHNKKNKLAISEMFCTEIKFAVDCLLKWYHDKYDNLELTIESKNEFEKKNPIDWQNGECVLCRFPLEANPTNPQNEKMSYGDFIIKKEHMFLRNIFSKEELAKSSSINTFESFHMHFIKFLEIVVFLEEEINLSQHFSQCRYPKLIAFIETHLSEFDSFDDIKQEIKCIKVKRNANSKISEFNLQLYAFVYDKVMTFPFSKFEYETVTTADLFLSVHKIINAKIHLHHSHVTGEVKGYAHDFCN